VTLGRRGDTRSSSCHYVGVMRGYYCVTLASVASLIFLRRRMSSSRGRSNRRLRGFGGAFRGACGST